MSKWVVDIHGDIEGDYELIKEYEEPKTDTLDKIETEIKKWYFQADKQALAKDPCIVDAMVDLFIRTIDKYRIDKEGEEK